MTVSPASLMIGNVNSKIFHDIARLCKTGRKQGCKLWLLKDKILASKLWPACAWMAI